MARRTRRPRLRRGGGLPDHGRRARHRRQDGGRTAQIETAVPQGERHPARSTAVVVAGHQSHVKADLRKISDGRKLSPILLVRGNAVDGFALQIADGYHRVCASYLTDENTDIPCRLVSWQSESRCPGSAFTRWRCSPSSAWPAHCWPRCPASGSRSSSASWSPGSSSAEPVSASSTMPTRPLRCWPTSASRW